LEVVNAMLTAVRRGRIPGEDVPLVFGTMQRFRVEIDRGIDPEHLARVTLNLGVAHQLSSYDATYLELAIRRGLPLATLDRRLRDAAGAAGVQFFQP
jgi:predicted nucleic acid-binding protein